MSPPDWIPYDYEQPDASQQLPAVDQLVWVFDTYYEGLTLGRWNGRGWRGVNQGDDIGVVAWMPLQWPLTGPLCQVCGRPITLNATDHETCRP